MSTLVASSSVRLPEIDLRFRDDAHRLRVETAVAVLRGDLAPEVASQELNVDTQRVLFWSQDLAEVLLASCNLLPHDNKRLLILLQGNTPPDIELARDCVRRAWHAAVASLAAERDYQQLVDSATRTARMYWRIWVFSFLASALIGSLKLSEYARTETPSNHFAHAPTSAEVLRPLALWAILAPDLFGGGLSLHRSFAGTQWTAAITYDASSPKNHAIATFSPTHSTWVSSRSLTASVSLANLPSDLGLPIPKPGEGWPEYLDRTPLEARQAASQSIYRDLRALLALYATGPVADNLLEAGWRYFVARETFSSESDAWLPIAGIKGSPAYIAWLITALCLGSLLLMSLHMRHIHTLPARPTTSWLLFHDLAESNRDPWIGPTVHAFLLAFTVILFSFAHHYLGGAIPGAGVAIVSTVVAGFAWHSIKRTELWIQGKKQGFSRIGRYFPFPSKAKFPLAYPRTYKPSQKHKDDSDQTPTAGLDDERLPSGALEERRCARDIQDVNRDHEDAELPRGRPSEDRPNREHGQKASDQGPNK